MKTVDELMALAMKAADAELAWDIASSKHPDDKKFHGVDKARAALETALKAAIAPVDAQPVAWRWGVPKLIAGSYEWRYSLNKTRDDSIPLYTHSAPLRELSDSEILEIAHRKATQYNYEAPSAWVMHGFSKLHTLNFARAVLKAAGGKQ